DALDKRREVLRAPPAHELVINRALGHSILQGPFPTGLAASRIVSMMVSSRCVMKWSNEMPPPLEVTMELSSARPPRGTCMGSCCGLRGERRQSPVVAFLDPDTGTPAPLC